MLLIDRRERWAEKYCEAVEAERRQDQTDVQGDYTSYNSAIPCPLTPIYEIN